MLVKKLSVGDIIKKSLLSGDYKYLASIECDTERERGNLWNIYYFPEPPVIKKYSTFETLDGKVTYWTLHQNRNGYWGWSDKVHDATFCYTGREVWTYKISKTPEEIMQLIKEFEGKTQDIRLT